MDAHSKTKIVISGSVPERIDFYDPKEYNWWVKTRKEWLRSGQRNWRLWGVYQDLAKCSRFVFTPRKQPHFQFPETWVAKRLEDQGYTCWTAARLFHSRALDASPYKECTREVEQLLTECGLPRPNDHRSRVNFVPKNPDIIAFNRKTGHWRFVEVKRDDCVHENQVKGLGLLHVLLNEPVEIVRIVRTGQKGKPREHDYTFKYRGPLMRPVRSTSLHLA